MSFAKNGYEIDIKTISKLKKNQNFIKERVTVYSRYLRTMDLQKMKRKPTERPNTGRLPVSCPNVKRGIEQSLKRSVQMTQNFKYSIFKTNFSRMFYLH